MSTLGHLGNVWTIIREINLTALRAQAELPFHIALLGSDQEALQWLADALRTDPYDQSLASTPQALWFYRLPARPDMVAEAVGADVILLVLPTDQANVAAEEQALTQVREAAQAVPVIAVHIKGLGDGAVEPPGDRRLWRVDGEAIVDAGTPHPLESELVPALMARFPDRDLSMGQHIPATRPPIARQLISETSFAGASYAGTTGVAEIIPVLNIPLALADIIVLTKNQVVLSYKLALALGQKGTTQQLVGPVAGIIGSSLIWRQVARTLAGLVPFIGLVPKIAIAYSGTYVTGHAVYNWYAYGKQLDKQRMKALTAEAAAEAKIRTAGLIAAVRNRKDSQPGSQQAKSRGLRLPLFSGRSSRCPSCQQKVNRKQQFCPNCGQPLGQAALPEPGPITPTT